MNHKSPKFRFIFESSFFPPRIDDPNSLGLRQVKKTTLLSCNTLILSGHSGLMFACQGSDSVT